MIICKIYNVRYAVVFLYVTWGWIKNLCYFSEWILDFFEMNFRDFCSCCFVLVGISLFFWEFCF